LLDVNLPRFERCVERYLSYPRLSALTSNSPILGSEHYDGIGLMYRPYVLHEDYQAHPGAKPIEFVHPAINEASTAWASG
jgi:hypothetical protein